MKKEEGRRKREEGRKEERKKGNLLMDSQLYSTSYLQTTNNFQYGLNGGELNPLKKR
ncbi:MAG: hypothetical protein F6K17_08825 [Okeania sp. SIO3C4]|nr:hypothetical protein [Okeania sp. SIO3C4]